MKLPFPIRLPQLTAKATSPKGVEWVSSTLFFLRSLKLPEDLPEGDIRAFAELHLEEHSPFPLDQLAWGCVKLGIHPDLCIYAVLKSRLPSELLENWEKAPHILPAFLPALLARDHEPVIAFDDGHSVSLFIYGEGSLFPKKALHLPIEYPPSPEELQAARSEGVAHLVAKGRVKSPGRLFVAAQASLLADGSLKMELESLPLSVAPDEAQPPEAIPVKTPERHTVLLDADSNRWTADLRGTQWSADQRRKRGISLRLWQAALGSVYAAALLVALFLLSLGLDAFSRSQLSAIIRQQPAVDIVASNALLLERLDVISKAAFDPLSVLEVANEQRPDEKMEFDSVSLSNDGSFEIRGFVDEPNTLNDFVTRLTNTTLFETRLQPSTEPKKDRFGNSVFGFRVSFLSRNETIINVLKERYGMTDSQPKLPEDANP